MIKKETTTQKYKKLLINIFIEYKVNTRLSFTSFYPTEYCIEDKSITINIGQIKSYIPHLRLRTGLKTLKEMLIFCLLHEICHAIQHQRKTLLPRLNKITKEVYFNSNKHDTFDFEVEADNFAKKEIQKYLIKRNIL